MRALHLPLKVPALWSLLGFSLIPSHRQWASPRSGLKTLCSYLPPRPGVWISRLRLLLMGSEILRESEKRPRLPSPGSEQRNLSARLPPPESEPKNLPARLPPPGSEQRNLPARLTPPEFDPKTLPARLPPQRSELTRAGSELTTDLLSGGWSQVGL